VTAIRKKKGKVELLANRKVVEVVVTEEIPNLLDVFPSLTSNDVDKYEQVVDHTFIKYKINAGELLDKVNPEKQARHIQSTVEEGKSYFFDDVDIESLYNKYKMTGTIRKLRKGSNGSD
ncbi:hypothetical protein KJQ97_09475, partial [Campylobacter sp. 2018MI01]|uniref:polymorphic toxin type 50 domain-containing protein n=1 Tax=Campylobacter sp. 2018MI01 TaxID=2836735 RepID=UPI001BD9FA2F